MVTISGPGDGRADTHLTPMRALRMFARSEPALEDARTMQGRPRNSIGSIAIGHDVMPTPTAHHYQDRPSRPESVIAWS